MKPLHSSIGKGDSHGSIQLKLVEGSGIELRGQTFVSTTVDVTPLNDVVSSNPALHVAPMIARSAGKLRQQKTELEAQSGRELADLSLYFDITLRPNASGTSAEGLIDALNALPIVELAGPAPKPVRPPTPDFSGYQGYRYAAPGGIGATGVTSVPGARGDYVQVADIEYSWNVNHEDLSDARATGAFIANGTPNDPYSDTNHGTAVIGELSADNNGFGVTGIVPNARLRLVNADNTSTTGLELADAIYLAAQNLAAGDVILIEQQTQAFPYQQPCPALPKQCGLVAVEYVQAWYDAITWATAAGIIVVEPAGNGSQNLNGSEYAATFNGRTDSGAIIVGAGTAPGNNCGTNPPHSRMNFSNYGAFVDLQGWGECVVTTGYGDFQNPSVNALYTYQFSGTSSASPIVAGAAAAYSSAMEYHAGTNPTSKQVRSALVSTGTPQDTTSAGALTGKIGPLPNLSAALDTTRPKVTAPVQALVKAKVGTTVQEKISWSATDASGIASYQLWVSTNGGAFVRDTSLSPTATTVTYTLSAGKSYQFFVRAFDTWGNSSTDAGGYGPKLTPSVSDDRSSSISYFAASGQASSWVYRSFAEAYNQTITKSTKAGEYARYSFTGRDVAFVASLGTTRGYANVFLDNVFFKSVKLYSSNSSGATVVLSAHWATSGTHTIDVQTVAVSGYPTAIDVDAFVVNQ